MDLLIVLLCVLTAAGVYIIFAVLLRLPDGKAANAVRNARGSRGWGQGIENKIVMPVAKKIGRVIRLPEMQREKLANDLERMHVKMTPEVYVALSVTQAVFMVGIGTLFALLIAPWAMLVFVALAVLLLARTGMEEHQRISLINDRIEGELPRMIEVMQFTMQNNHDLIAFFERYLLVAGPELKPEIERLLFDMKSGNAATALNGFKNRIRLYTVGEFAAACIGIYQGLDYQATLNELMKNVLKTEEERYRRELDRRPRKMFPAHAEMFLALGLIIGVPFIMMIFELFQKI